MKGLWLPRGLIVLAFLPGANGAAVAAAPVRDCPIEAGPTVSAPAGKGLLVVGRQRERARSRSETAPARLVSCLVTKRGRLAAPARALTRFTATGERVDAEALAYNRRRREFLLISGSHTPTPFGAERQRLRLHRLSPDGGAADLGTPLPQVPGRADFRPRAQLGPAVACGGAGACLIAWIASEFSPGGQELPEEAVVGIRFRPGKRLPRPFRISEVTRSLDPSSPASVMSRGRSYVAAWSEELFERSFLLTRTIKGNGKATTTFPFRVAAGETSATAPALAAGPRGSVGAVWLEAGDLQYLSFHPSRPGSVGAPLALTAYGNSRSAAEPTLTYDPRRRRFAVAWSRLIDRPGGRDRSDVQARTVEHSSARTRRTRTLSRSRRTGRGRSSNPALVRLAGKSFASWFADRQGVILGRLP